MNTFIRALVLGAIMASGTSLFAQTGDILNMHHVPSFDANGAAICCTDADGFVNFFMSDGFPAENIQGIMVPIETNLTEVTHLNYFLWGMDGKIKLFSIDSYGVQAPAKNLDTRFNYRIVDQAPPQLVGHGTWMYVP